MSDSIKKYYEQKFFFDEGEPIKRFNNTLTPLQAQNILNNCILAVEDENLKEDIYLLKKYLKSKL